MDREIENIDLTVIQQKEVIDLIKYYIPNTEVWVYGSRVKFTSRPASDLDIVAFSTPEQKMDIYNLKEAFEESDIPFRVDLFVWDEIPKQFKNNIKSEHIILL